MHPSAHCDQMRAQCLCVHIPLGPIFTKQITFYLHYKDHQNYEDLDQILALCKSLARCSILDTWLLVLIDTNHSKSAFYMVSILLHVFILLQVSIFI